MTAIVTTHSPPFIDPMIDQPVARLRRLSEVQAQPCPESARARTPALRDTALRMPWRDINDIAVVTSDTSTSLPAAAPGALDVDLLPFDPGGFVPIGYRSTRTE